MHSISEGTKCVFTIAIRCNIDFFSILDDYRNDSLRGKEVKEIEEPQSIKMDYEVNKRSKYLKISTMLVASVSAVRRLKVQADCYREKIIL